jgi:hypothetical protein
MLWRILLAVVRFCSWLLIRTPTHSRTRLAGRSLTFSGRRYSLDFGPLRIITISKPPTEQQAKEHAARIERESASLAPLDPRD